MQHDLREAMVRGELLDSRGALLLEDVIVVTGVLSSVEAVAGAWEKKDDCFSATTFVGEAKRLSGRMCSKLLNKHVIRTRTARNIQQTDIRFGLEFY